MKGFQAFQKKPSKLRLNPSLGSQDTKTVRFGCVYDHKEKKNICSLEAECEMADILRQHEIKN